MAALDCTVDAAGAAAAAPTVLYMFTLPGYSASALAASLRDAVPALRAGPHLAVPTAEELAAAERHTERRFLVLVEHPAGAAAQAIRSGGDVAAALAAWSDAARALLRWVRRLPARCLCVDSGEALASPQAFAAALAAADPTLAGVRLPTMAAETDPLVDLLARTAADEDVTARRLFTELQACCLVLLAAAAPMASWPAAAHRFRELEAGAAAAQVEAARLAGAVEQAQQKLGQAQAELAQVRQATERAAGEHAAARDAARRDAELLALQLEQAQEELDTLYERRAAAGDGGAGAVYADALSILDSAQRAPHRHLHVDLRGVRAGRHRWASIEVRLVEHLGRPGLAFFGLGRSPEPIAAWKATGREQVREYMLFVPSDDNGQRQLAMLGATDWQMVLGTTGLLVRHLQRHGGDLAADWLRVARRLQADLLGLEPRLRYDGCTAARDTADADAWRIEFHEALFGTHPLGPLRLCWQPARGELAWLAPEDAALPLAGWPGDAAGSLAAAFTIPVGPGGDAAAHRAWWAAQPPANRALLLAVLEALPEAVRRDPGAAALSVTAQSLSVVARAGLRRAAWRAAARRLFGRRSTSARTD